MLVELHPLVRLKSLRLALIFVEIFYKEIVFPVGFIAAEHQFCCWKE